jgi:hypothetical protein
MPWGAVIGAAVSLYGASQQNKAADKGAKAQEHASQAAIDEQRREFDLARGDQAPWLQSGQWALPRLQDTLNGNYTGFFKSPDYLATQAEGVHTIDQSAAAHGGLFGGGHTRDLARFGQGLAAQQLGSYRSALGTLAGYGQNSAQNLGTLGQNMATNIGNQYNNMGNARQSMYQQRGDTNAQLAGSLGNLYGQYFGQGGSGGWGGI